MAIPFLNPALLWGLAGAAVPVFVHLLGRRKGRERRFAAIDFLLASEKRLAARRRLRNLLLLLCRVALLAALVLALARPLVRGEAAVAAAEPVSAVVVLDASASMSAGGREGRAFDRAQALAGDVLERLPVGSEVLVTTIERTPRRLNETWVSSAEGRRRLESVKDPGFTAGRLDAALGNAFAALAGAHRAQHLVLLATDLQRTGIDLAALGRLERPPGTRLVVLDAGQGVGENLALVGAERGERDGDLLTVTALSSGGTAGTTEALVRLEVEGKLANRSLLRPGENGRATANIRLPLDVPRGAEVALALPVGGSLAADDRRFVHLDRPGVVSVLLLDGAPSPDLYQDEVFYLERALEADPSRFHKTVADESTGELPSLLGYDVVVLANPGPVTARAGAALEGFVAAGGGLLVTLGDRLAPQSLLDGFDRNLGSLLPARARSLHAARPGEPPLQLAPPGHPLHPVLLPFDSAAAAESLASARFTRLVAVEPAAGATTLLKLENGLPVLLEAGHGAGRVALLTTSVDRAWSDLPVKPGYLPVMSRLLFHLAGRLDRPRQHDYLCGDPVVLEADEWIRPGERLTVESKGGVIEPAETAPGRFEIDVALTPGAYAVSIAGRREPRLDFVVNLDPREADLGRVSGEELKAVLGADTVVGGAGEAVAVRSEATLLAAGLAVAAFALEALLGLPKHSRAGAAGARPETAQAGGI